MPYDARPISEGGNRGAGELFKLKAPKGKYRVVCVDTFDGGDWVSGDFDTLAEAKKHADSKGGTMQKAYVYDDTGRYMHDAGSF